jgi:hypothetical protein
MKTHWYDRLWGHLQNSVDMRDMDRVKRLLVLRRAYGLAETKEEIALVRLEFARWEEMN